MYSAVNNRPVTRYNSRWFLVISYTVKSGGKRRMRSIFEDRQVSIKCDDKYSYTVTKDGLTYVPGNGKPEVRILFSEVGSTFLLNYCSSNGPYEITFKDNEGHNVASIDTDLKLREFGHNSLGHQDYYPCLCS